MSHSGLAGARLPTAWPPGLGPALRACLVGYVYWLAFVLVLEPEIFFGLDGRHDLGEEVLRVCLAALLGSSISPLVLAGVRRFPLDDARVVRHAVLYLCAILLVSAVLIFLSCVLADWFLASEQRPFAVALREEFKFNFLLVAFCMAAYVAFFHTRFAQQLCGVGEVTETPPKPQYLSSLPVKVRGETIHLALAEVGWIESQGNYLALHTGTGTHLVRESIGAIEARLNPQDFVRVHRGSIVAVDQVKGLSPMGSGDACLRLMDGSEVRLSRKYRAMFLGIWNRRAQASTTAQ